MNVIKRGAIAGIVTLAAVILNLILYFILSSIQLDIAALIVSLIFWIVNGICTIFFFYAFIVLARKANIGLLKVMSYIFCILATIFSVFMVIFLIYLVVLSAVDLNAFGTITGNVIDKFNYTTQFTNEQVSAMIGSLMGVLIATFLATIMILFIITLGVATLYILFGVGLIKLGEKIPIAKTAGILNIISVGLILTLVGAFLGGLVLVIAFIFEIIVLFKGSEKFERKHHPKALR